MGREDVGHKRWMRQKSILLYNGPGWEETALTGLRWLRWAFLSGSIVENCDGHRGRC